MPENYAEIYNVVSNAVASGTYEVVPAFQYGEETIDNLIKITSVTSGTVATYYGILESGGLAALVSAVPLSAVVAGAAVAMGIVGGALVYNKYPNVFDSIYEKLQNAGKLIEGNVLSFFKADGSSYVDYAILSDIKDQFLADGLFNKEYIADLSKFENMQYDTEYSFDLTSLQSVTTDYIESTIELAKQTSIALSSHVQYQRDGIDYFQNSKGYEYSYGGVYEYGMQVIPNSILKYENVQPLIANSGNVMSQYAATNNLQYLLVGVIPNFNIETYDLGGYGNHYYRYDGGTLSVSCIYLITSGYDAAEYSGNISCYKEKWITNRGEDYSDSTNYNYADLRSLLQDIDVIRFQVKKNLRAFVNVDSYRPFNQYNAFTDVVKNNSASINTLSRSTKYYFSLLSSQDYLNLLLTNYQCTISKHVLSTTLGNPYSGGVPGYAVIGGVFYRGMGSVNSNYQFDLKSFASGAFRISIQDNATLPETDKEIQETYPDWYSRSTRITVTDPDGIPVEMPASPLTLQPQYDWGDNANQDGAQEGDTQKPEEQPKPWLNIGDDWFNTPEEGPSDDPDVPVQPDNPPDDNPNPDTDPPGNPNQDYENATDPPSDPTDPNPQKGDESGKPILPTFPTTEYGGGVATVFNPTNGQMQSLANYLWGEDSWKALLQAFANPLECIVSFHQVYSGVSTGNSQEIYLGWMPTGINAVSVTKRYNEIDLGSVSVGGLYNNSIDYNPYSTAHIYLPFSGFAELDIQDVMQGTIRCKYVVDVYTGDASIALYVSKNVRQSLNEQMLYSYSTNVGIESPLFASSFWSMMAKTVGSTAMGLASGGMIGGLLAGAGTAVSSGVHYSKSGNLRGNIGATLQLNPFIQIDSPLSYDANNYKEFYGYPSNKAVYIGNCQGYVRVRECHLVVPNATADEMEELEGILKAGFYV